MYIDRVHTTIVHYTIHIYSMRYCRFHSICYIQERILSRSDLPKVTSVMKWMAKSKSGWFIHQELPFVCERIVRRRSSLSIEIQFNSYHLAFVLSYVKLCQIIFSLQCVIIFVLQKEHF